MAKDKKSFVLYSDQRNVIDLLTDEQAGKLLKHLFAYVNDEEPKLTDQLITIAFEPIKQQLKRDLIKWGETREHRSRAGKISAEKRKKKKQQVLTSVECVEQTSTKSTVNVNVNVNVINKEFEWFWSVYDKKISKDKCKKKFATLKQPEITAIKNTLEAYIRSTPNKKYRKNPITYLNNEAWNDEIDFKEPSNQLNNVNGKSLKELWQ